jgi:hypothetical protein
VSALADALVAAQRRALAAVEKQYAALRCDDVIVRVAVVRMVLEPRTDVDGVEDFYIIDRQTVSEREWVEPREKARIRRSCLSPGCPSEVEPGELDCEKHRQLYGEARTQQWVVLSRGFVYGPFQTREQAGLWCVSERKTDCQVAAPLNTTVRS